MLVAAGLLLLLAQVLKAFGWARLFRPEEGPSAVALAAGNAGPALIGVVEANWGRGFAIDRRRR